MNGYLVRSNKNNGVLDAFDDSFDSFFKPMFYEEKFNKMKTDIKERENEYVMDIEIPGFDKNDISLSLENGYLTVSVNRKEEEKEGKKENYLRRERSYSMSRSYYVGSVKETDIKAKYENGLLQVFIPKEVEKQPASHAITIE